MGCDGLPNLDGCGGHEHDDHDEHHHRCEVEPLPSVIANFITAFFGTLTKTCNPATGDWTWTLPCDLDAGIPGFPRIEGEGLACYFARILSEGVTGLAGKNAFTLTTMDATQPALAATFTVGVDNLDPFFVGQYVAASVGGFYTVSAIDPVGMTLTLVNPYAPPFNLSPGGDIPIGTKIVPSGVPESSGPQGPQGPVGPSGGTGPTGPSGNNAYGNTAADFVQPAVLSTVVVLVASTIPFQVGEYVWGASAGFYQITALDSGASTLTLLNLLPVTSPVTPQGNVAPGTTVPSGTTLLPSGIAGPTGPQGAQPTQFWNFKTAGTYSWLCPAGITAIVIRVYGGGGGGGGAASATNGGANGFGGGGGEYAFAVFTVVPGDTYTVTVGAGGEGGSGGDSSANGTAGDTSLFESGASIYLSAVGGNGGGAGDGGAAGTGGTGGAGSAVLRIPGFDALVTQGGMCGRDGTGGLGGNPIGANGENPGGGGGAGIGDVYGGAGSPGGNGGTGLVIIESVDS